MEAWPPPDSGGRDAWSSESVAAGTSDVLTPALTVLDALLRAALEEARRLFGPDAVEDPYRGLYLTPEDVARGLEGGPGQPLFAARAAAVLDAMAAASPGLARFGGRFGLSPFDLALLVVAAAPEVDLRYQRAYAVLQDDVTRSRPSLDLALNLLTVDAADKLARRSHVAADAALRTSDLLELRAPAAAPQAPLLAQELAAAPAATAFLLGMPGPEPGLYPLRRPAPNADAAPTLSAAALAPVRRSVQQAAVADRPLRLYLRGVHGSGRQAIADRLARAAGTQLLALDLVRAPVDETTFERLLRGAFVEAALRGWVLYLADADTVEARWGESAAARLLAAVMRHPGVVILAGASPWWAPEGVACDVATVEVPRWAPYPRRRAAWHRSLRGSGLAAPRGVVAEVADRFELSPAQIAGAAAAAAAAVTGRTSDGQPGASSNAHATRSAGADREPTDSEALRSALRTAALGQTGRELAEQARLIEAAYCFDDLVLPTDAERQLRELCARVVHRRRVLDDWGFGRRLPLGTGVHALFSGPSGTGKTMAAQVVAGALGLDLYRIDLAQVVSKYIGETEKNLGRIFGAAETSNAILFFDEADALFGKRTEVKDAHDRYANIEVGYLLQKMEEYPGVTILATNLRQNMDEAFVRRLTFHVAFPLPDEADRVSIWQRLLAAGVPLDPDVDVSFLGRRFKVSGGNIRNVVLAAAFLAAADDGPIAMRHLVRGMRREFQKLGKACVQADFDPYFGLLDADRPAASTPGPVAVAGEL